ncbi:MAG: hypothetical protein EPN21_03315 [Methylococcaceae bacterium]|nr:MAG: hypothetical protein EPN21_03315 [Methylococcaceae bacterium]
MAIMPFETTIQPWGNSLGLRITRALSTSAHLDRGTVVTVEVVEEGLLVKPKLAVPRPRVFPFTEAALVEGLTPAKAHADELPVGLSSEWCE